MTTDSGNQPRRRAIDALVNSSFLNDGDSPALSYLFKDIGERPSITEPADLVRLLDAADIGAAVVSIMEPAHADWVGEAHRQYPDKVLPAMIVDPTKGMPEIRRVTEYYDQHGVRCLRIPPFRYSLPPTDRAYWPFYVKAIELDIAVSMNVGMPGPRKPGWVQNPMYVDEVAYHFPELRIVMTHCGQPWTSEVLSVLAHWDNVYMACTSVAPRYWPPEFVQFINTRGKDRMMFGTEYPTIDWNRARTEIESLGLRPEVLPGFFVENARRAYKWDANPG